MDRSKTASLADYFRLNYHRLVVYVSRRLRDSASRSSEDIVQDVMLSILDKPDILAPVADLSSYVFSALRNRVIDHYRSRRGETVSLDSRDEEGLSLFDIIPDRRYQPEDSYHRESLRRLVFQLIKELPEAQMRVIVETEFNQRTFRELSEEWDVPLGTLLARKHRGLNSVRKKLEDMLED